MEDLSQFGVVPLFQQQGLSVDQTMHVANSLAHLHAWSLQNTHDMSHFNPPPPETVQILLAFVIGSLEKLRNEFRGFFGPTLDRAITSCQTVEDLSYAFTAHEKFQMPPVLAHGDVWISNLMFKNDDNSNCTDIDSTTSTI